MRRNIDSRLGISCTNPDILRGRLLVSGQEILDPSVAEQRGYGRREVIAPTTPHRPTDKQLEAIMANERTPQLLHLVSLPASIGEKAIRLCQEPGFTMDPTSYSDLGGGFIGAPLGSRLDPPDQVNVTVDSENLKVGDHIDTWEDPAVQFAVLNMGPGTRWHRITPAFSRDDMDGQRPSPEIRHTHMKNMIEAGLGECILAYWVLLNAPSVTSEDEPMIEAIVPSPVARYLHDGSTYEAEAESTAAFISIPRGASMATYRSLV